MLNAEIAGRFSSYLLPGERVRWAGAPKQGLVLQPGDALMIPFSLMWGGFAFFWEATVIASRAPLLFRLWGIPFVCVGVYLIAGRFFYDAFVRSRTYYALTEQRALILGGLRGGDLTTINLSATPEVRLTGVKGDVGTIEFGSDILPRSRSRGAPHFFQVSDVNTAYRAIQARKLNQPPA
jgi:hypothetical protein